MKKSIDQIIEDEKQLSEIRNAIYGVLQTPTIINNSNEIPVYFGTCPEKQTNDPQVGIMKNITIKDHRILGELEIDDSDEGRVIKELINQGVTVRIEPISSEGKTDV